MRPPPRPAPEVIPRFQENRAAIRKTTDLPFRPPSNRVCD